MFRLASHLGTTVSGKPFLHMSWREFVYWQHFLRIHPPDDAENHRFASLMAQITNMSGRTLSNGKKVSAEDFLNSAKPKQQSMEDQIAFMKSLSVSNGS